MSPQFKTFLPFWILAISVVCVLTLPSLVQQGMFMDAVLYTSVARNLSMGLGNFWFPWFDHVNVIGISSFHEQPPLVFGIVALFFKIFGDHFYTERIYTFFTLTVNAGLIVLLWRRVFKNEAGLLHMWWLALIFWISIPVCFWSYSNNMHENTMSIFVLLSIFLMYSASQKEGLAFLYWVMAGVMIGLAALSKGFPGLFTLSFPFLYWAITGKCSLRRMLLQNIILWGTLFLLGLILYGYPDSRESLSIYLFKRAFARITSAHSVDNRFFTLFRLISELLPGIAVTIIVMIVARFKKVPTHIHEQRQIMMLFFALGLCGTLPLMLTKVQNGFYMVAALPCFGMGFGILNATVLYRAVERISRNARLQRILLPVSLFLFAAVVVYSISQTCKYVRDQDLLQDVHKIGAAIPPFSDLETHSDAVFHNVPLQNYLVRYYNITLNINDCRRVLYLHTQSNLPDSVRYWQAIDAHLAGFALYKK